MHEQGVQTLKTTETANTLRCKEPSLQQAAGRTLSMLPHQCFRDYILNTHDSPKEQRRMQYVCKKNAEIIAGLIATPSPKTDNKNCTLQY